MKRDWELVRQILLGLEALDDTTSVLRPDDITGYDADNVNYHLRLLDEAGLIQARISAEVGRPARCTGQRLTWTGHQLLDNMRDQTVWNRIKATVREKGLDLSFEAIKLVGPLVVRQLLQG